ncbi:MAG: hypothetical protein GY737_21185 [Desulfobacteraceae bacterium]|nr:hypothetical protein [Desulfobacteraceae bacterium]
MKETRFNIGDLHRISNRTPKNTDGVGKNKPSGGFDTILSNTLADNDPADTLAPSSLGEISSPVPVLPMDEPGIDIPAGIDTALDLFERYTLLLGDASKSLRDIAPVLTELTGQARRLAEQVQDTPSVDTRLSAIVDHMLSTATLEQFKMERGDYTDR